MEFTQDPESNAINQAMSGRRSSLRLKRKRDKAYISTSTPETQTATTSTPTPTKAKKSQRASNYNGHDEIRSPPKKRRKISTNIDIKSGPIPSLDTTTITTNTDINSTTAPPAYTGINRSGPRPPYRTTNTSTNTGRYRGSTQRTPSNKGPPHHGSPFIIYQQRIPNLITNSSDNSQ